MSGRKGHITKSVRCGKRELQCELACMVADVDATSAAEAEASRLTLTELSEEHIACHEGSPTTLRTYRSTLESHIRPTIGRLAVRDVDAAILDRSYEHVTDEKGLSSSSVHQAHAIIRGALRRAVRWGRLATNPARDAAPSQVRRTETGIPSAEQVLEADPRPRATARAGGAAGEGGRRGSPRSPGCSAPTALGTGSTCSCRAIVRRRPRSEVRRGVRRRVGLRRGGRSARLVASSWP